MQLEEYIKILDQKYIICPEIIPWRDLFNMFERYCETDGEIYRGRKSMNHKRYLLPLILLAWEDTSDWDKNERFKFSGIPKEFKKDRY